MISHASGIDRDKVLEWIGNETIDCNVATIFLDRNYFESYLGRPMSEAEWERLRPRLNDVFNSYVWDTINENVGETMFGLDIYPEDEEYEE